MKAYPDKIDLTNNDEIDKLRTFLLSQGLPYEGYEGWVEKTIEKVKEGVNKVALGLFDGNDIVGDCIIRITASNNVEVKNLYLSPDYRGDGNASSLLTFVETWCRRHHHYYMKVDAYITQTDLVHFLVAKGYSIDAKVNLYGWGTESYILSKELPLTYDGPLNLEDLCLWVMRFKFNYEDFEDIDDAKIRMSLTIEGQRLYGTLFIIDDPETEIEGAKVRELSSQDGVRGHIFITGFRFSEDAISTAEGLGITLLDATSLSELSGFHVPSQPEEISGCIVIIRPNYFEILSGSEDRVYIKSARNPSGLMKGMPLLFYVTNPQKALVGFAHIEDYEKGKPEDMWLRYERLSAFTEEQFRDYCRMKEQVTVFRFDKLETFTDPIPLDELFDLVESFNPQWGGIVRTSEWSRIQERL